MEQSKTIISIKPLDQVRIKKTVTGIFKKIHYANSGEIVKIISISKPAVIVENNKKERFTTVLNNIETINQILKR